MTPWRTAILGILGLMGVGVVALAVRAANPPAARAPEKSLIAWMDYKEGSKLAMSEKRPMMMDFATSWCGWCKKLDAEVYTAPKVVELSKQFVCIKIDGDAETQLVTQYKVEGYPTIVFANSKGEEASRIPGFAPADDFAKEMKSALAKVGVTKTK